MKAIYASPALATSQATHGEPEDWPTPERIASINCQKEIDAYYLSQLDQLDTKIQGEKTRKEQKLTEFKKKTNIFFAVEVVAGIILFLFGLSLIKNGWVYVFGLLVISGTTAVVYKTNKQRSSKQEELSVSLNQAVSSLEKASDNFKPEIRCRVGHFWWAFQLVKQPDKSAVLIDLARTGMTNPISLVKEPAQPRKKQPQAREKAGQSQDQAGAFAELLDDFGQLAYEAMEWEIVPARLPILSKDISMARDLTHEMESILNARLVLNGKEDILFLTSGGLKLLSTLTDQQAADWLKCCQNAAGWSAYFNRLSDRSKKTREGVLRAIQQAAEDVARSRPEPASGRARPNSILADLSTQRPDVKQLLDQLREEKEQLVREIDGGAEHEQRKKLLEELGQVLEEAYSRPWPDTWLRSINELKDGYGGMTSRLDSVEATFRELSAAVKNLQSQYAELGRLNLDNQLSRMQGLYQRTTQAADKLPKSYTRTPAQPNLGSIHEYGQLTESLQQSAGALESTNAALASLDQSSRELAAAFATYERRTSQALNDASHSADQLNRIMDEVNEDMQDRRAAIAEYQNRLRGIQEEFSRQTALARGRAKVLLSAAEETQKSVAWLAYQPETLVAELAGVERNTIEELGSDSASHAIQEMIWAKIHQALDAGSEKVTELCKERKDHIEVAHQLWRQALKVTTSQACDADMILIPIWYVEWRETPAPELAAVQQEQYRLVLPVRPSKPGTESPMLPLYPGIGLYMQSFTPPEFWTSVAEPDHPPALVKAIRESVRLSEVTLEPRAGIP